MAGIVIVALAAVLAGAAATGDAELTQTLDARQTLVRGHNCRAGPSAPAAMAAHVSIFHWTMTWRSVTMLRLQCTPSHEQGGGSSPGGRQTQATGVISRTAATAAL